MRCVSPVTVYDGPSGISVPCGSCMACRINRTSDWSTRVMCELSYYDRSSFITLTFDDEHFGHPSLSKRDLQLFFKRVRKMFDVDVKYLACGEYGPTSMRKHYHAIVLGVDFKPWVVVSHKDGHPIYTSESLSRLWPFGFVTVDEVNEQDCNYVAGYIRKKLTGAMSNVYTDSGLEPPFQLQSKGIGLRFALDNRDRLSHDLCIRSKGVPKPIPGYMKRKIGLCDPIPDIGMSPMQLRRLEISSSESEKFEKSIYSDMYDYEFLYRNAARRQKAVDLKSSSELFDKRDKL